MGNHEVTSATGAVEGPLLPVEPQVFGVKDDLIEAIRDGRIVSISSLTTCGWPPARP